MNLLSPSHNSLRNQVRRVLVLEPQNLGSLKDTFWQLLSLSFSSEPAGLEGSKVATHLLSNSSSFPCTVAGPRCPQAAVNRWITDCTLLQRKAILNTSSSSRVWGKERRLTSLGLLLGFSHWLCPVASFHLLDSKVIFHETVHIGKKSLGLFLI